MFDPAQKIYFLVHILPILDSLVFCQAVRQRVVHTENISGQRDKQSV